MAKRPRLPQKRDFVLKALTVARTHRLARRVNRQQVSILMYHGFRDKPVASLHNYSGMHVDVRAFENQVRYLKRHYNVVPLKRVVDWMEGVGTLPPHAVALTIDDGYESVYRLAYPVLRAFEIPASVFVATGFLNGTHPLWTDRIRLALGRLAERQSIVELQVAETSMTLDVSDPVATVRSTRQLFSMLKPMATSSVQSLVQQLERRSLTGCVEEDVPSVYAPMSWEHAREMAASGLITIGSHTVTHSLLGRTSSEDVAWDLESSRREIEDRVGQECWAFCYPNGAIGDFHKQTERLVRAAGYRCALTTVPGLNSHVANPFELRRVSVSDEDSFAEFEAAVSGLRPALGNVQARIRRLRRLDFSASSERFVSR